MMSSIPTFGLQELRQAIEQNFGPLTYLRIIPPDDPDSGSAMWTATGMDGDQIEGMIEVRLVQQKDGTLALRPKVLIEGASGRLLDLLRLGDPDGGFRDLRAAVPRQLLEDRLQQIATRLRRLLTRIRTQPQMPAQEMAAELGAIVGIAERGQRS